MSEPEDVVIDAAHVVAEQTLALWQRHSADAGPETVRLEPLKRRLSLFLSATFGFAPTIVVAEPPRVPSFLVRWFRGTPKFAVRTDPLPSTDGQRIRLPREVVVETDRDRVVDRYRIWALEQTVRLSRQTPRLVPEASDDPTRWLYLLAEAAAVDRHIAEQLPGMASTIAEERRIALADRPDIDAMNAAERRIERRLRRLLEAPADAPPEAIPLCETPEDSRAWADSQVDGADREGEFRGLPAVPLFGDIETEAAPPSEDASNGRGAEGGDRNTSHVDRRPRSREAQEDEDDDGEGMFMVPLDDLHETAQDPMGLQRPVDRDDEVDPDELAESLAEMEQGRLVRTDDPAREVLVGDDPPPRGQTRVNGEGVDGIRYPEWDFRAGGYREGAAVVRPRVAEEGRQSWLDGALADHAALIRDVRRCFEQLRPERKRLRRQPDGPDIDLNAYVEAHADRRAGRAPDDRLYRCIRPGRREVAIHLLIDISASTDSWIRDQTRVIDVEKAALLVVCEALEALGDRYAVSGFSGRGPKSVSSRMVKDYEEHYRPEVRRRIAGLQPQSYTRAGAALRHATAQLNRQSVRHPLLLCLSDGKPNDIDHYEGRYGVEDTRQAVHEARMQGVDVFCLTIDREAPTYMDRIFGPTAYAVLHRPDILPRVLVRVIRRLLDR